MDTVARGLLAAANLIESGRLQEALEARYAGWSGELGRAIGSGKVGLAELHEHALAAGEGPQPTSGRQELLENWVRTGVEKA